MTPSPSEPALDRSVPPPPDPIRPFHLPDVRADALENGLRLRSIPRGRTPLVSACLVLDAGEAGVPPGREGLGVLTGDALQSGTRLRSGTELAEALERLGTRISISTGWDATTAAFTCVAERMDEMLSLVSEVIREPTFPPDEVERIRRQRLAAIRQRRMEPGQLADDALDRAVFDSEHPYHRPLSGVEASVAPLDSDAVAAFAAENYGPARGGVVMVGDLSSEQVRELSDRHFSGWDRPYAGRREIPAIKRGPAASLHLVHRPGAVQSELRIGHTAPPRGHESETALRVGNAILGGAFTSRLNVSLRERHGFTYGVHSRFALRRHGGAFTIATAVGTETTGAALEEALAVFRRFAEEGPSAEELERARDYLVGVFPLQMETTAQLAARLAELVIFDLPDDYHHRYRDRVREVDVEQARAAARRHLDPSGASVVVVGDADRVLPDLEGLGRGPVEVRDA